MNQAAPTAIQTPPIRLSRIALLLGIGLFCFAMVCIYFVWSMRQSHAHCQEIGARLTSILRSDDRFLETKVHFSTRPGVFILAPDELPAATKADLEKIVAEFRGSLQIPVSYYTLLPDFTPKPTDEATK